MKFWRGIAWPMVLLVVSARAELQVLLESDGQKLPLAGSDGTQLLVRRGAETIPAPVTGEWKVEGDLLQSSTDLIWLPPHAIAATAPHERRQGEPNLFEVHLGTSVAYTSAQTVFTESEAKAIWPQRIQLPAAGVILWIVNGKVAQVIVETEGQSPRYAMILARKKIVLAPGEERGFPVFMLWQNNHPITPKKLPGGSQAADAIASACLDKLDTAIAPVDFERKFVDQLGRNLLQLAAGAGAEKATATLLLKFPKRVDAHSATTPSPLSLAALDGRAVIVQKLLSAHASVNGSEENPTPLFLAAAAGHAEVVTELLQAKADIGASSDLRTPMEVALDHNYPDVLQSLRAVGVSFHITPHSPRLLLAKSALGATEIVEWLIAQGLDANAQVAGMSALMAGAFKGDGELVEVLVRNHARVNEINTRGETALTWAAESGNVRYAQALIKEGAAIDMGLKDGSTPLILAATADHGPMVECLLSAGAKLDQQDSHGFTALDRSLLSGAKDVLAILRVHGARLAWDGPHFHELIEQAVVLDEPEWVKFALAHGWTADSKVSGNWTLLQLAYVCRANSCMSLLDTKQSAPAAPIALVQIKALDAPPKLEAEIEPDDPRSSLEKFPKQEVDVSGLIDLDGRVHFLRVISPSPRRLNLAVLNAVSQWQFAPLMSQGKPVGARIVIPVIFPASADRHYLAEQIDQVPVPLKRIPPEYPFALRAANVQGTAMVRFTVGKDGQVHDVRAIQATYREFADAAVTCVQHWTFRPGVYDDKPVNVRVQMPISFTLSN